MTMTPRGIIIAWANTVEEIPAGWIICDGNNGTPDPRDRFIPGAYNMYEYNDPYGEKDHNHYISGGSHSHKAKAGDDIDSGSKKNKQTALATSSGITDEVSNLPPYHALIYIMKT